MAAANNKLRTAFILGYTGEVGSVLAKTLIEKQIFKKIILIGRRKVDLYEKMDNVEQRIVDFEMLEKFGEAFDGTDVGFCALGTTIKAAGTKENFRRVDFDYVKCAAELAKKRGTQQFLYISTQGANAKSGTFYFKTKGEIEDALTAIEFEHLSLLRPGLLLGESGRKERPPAEAFFRMIMKPLTKLSPTLMSVPVNTAVAALISLATGAETQKVGIYENAKVHEFGNNWLKEHQREGAAVNSSDLPEKKA